MPTRRYSGLIMDFAGVLTSNLVQVYDYFELVEGLKQFTVLRGWADPRGKDLYRRLELGEISQEQWNDEFGALIGVPADNLMGRLLEDLTPARSVLRAVKDARAAGVRTAVLSNSLGRHPHDPYAAYDLEAHFDVVVLSDEVGLRKPDPRIFQLTADRLGLSTAECLFADDTEENLPPAEALGMGVVHAVDEQEIALRLRSLLGLGAE
ncbi:HAD family phosphatase [Actinospica sp. MGRD01-02]|uniref:HAD family phosphatase n=1 Tax=Actinospica acidithermotolerans TaxID=2828514 RepID=A0A941E9R0_9ACTN|nr:HAD family phosphatase [Actinospica acidithermotolerans]MBR7827566.1 HAD family phosphatase [Actinospica acidithermotolerans]